jgi:hypothetical protein
MRNRCFSYLIGGGRCNEHTLTETLNFSDWIDPLPGTTKRFEFSKKAVLLQIWYLKRCNIPIERIKIEEALKKWSGMLFKDKTSNYTLISGIHSDILLFFRFIISKS